MECDNLIDQLLSLDTVPPENRPQLVSDLEEDPFVEHALTTA